MQGAKATGLCTLPTHVCQCPSMAAARCKSEAGLWLTWWSGAAAVAASVEKAASPCEGRRRRGDTDRCLCDRRMALAVGGLAGGVRLVSPNRSTRSCPRSN